MLGGGHPNTGWKHPEDGRRDSPPTIFRLRVHPPPSSPPPTHATFPWGCSTPTGLAKKTGPGCPRGAFFAPDVWGLSIPTVRNAKRAAGCPGVAAGPPQRGPRDIFAGIRGGSQTPPLGTPRRIFCTARLGGLTPESYGAKYAPRGARCSRRHPIGVTSGQLGDGAGTDGSPAPIF